MMKYHSQKKGFTLIEIMVSVAIFSIVMVISMGAIFTILNTDRKAQAIKSVMNNLNSALENMTRTIKTGSEYSIDPSYGDTCDGSSAAPYANAITIGSAVIDGAIGSNEDESVTYYLQGSQIWKSVTIGSNAPTTYSVTAPEVTIQRMCFYVRGNNVGGVADHIQPEVIMILQGFAGNGKTQSSFNLQSTISQRLLDS